MPTGHCFVVVVVDIVVVVNVVVDVEFKEDDNFEHPIVFIHALIQHLVAVTWSPMVLIIN